MTAGLAPARADRAGLGILMMLAAWGMFALVDTSVKWLVTVGMPALMLAFMRYAVAFAITLVLELRKGTLRDALAPPSRGILLARGFLLASATTVNFIALQFLPLTVTSAILFSSPIFVCALSGPLLGEHVGPWRWFAIVVGFFGVLLVIRPFDDDFDWVALIMLYNAVALALFSILTRKLSGTVTAGMMQIYMAAFGTVFLAPVLLWSWQTPASLLDWILTLGLGVFAWAGHELFTRAHLYGNASSLMPYSYSFLLYLTFTSWLVFGDLPELATLLGALVIAASGLLIWWRENRKALK